MGLFNRSKDKKPPKEIMQPESGIVRSENGQPVAIYKDKDGKIHKMSALCTHLECTVYWNSPDKSWDCPCHGSRFSPDGTVINGPADAPLEKME